MNDKNKDQAKGKPDTDEGATVNAVTEESVAQAADDTSAKADAVIEAEWQEADGNAAPGPGPELDAATSNSHTETASAAALAMAAGAASGQDPAATEDGKSRKLIYTWLALLTLGVGYVIYALMGDPGRLRDSLALGEAPAVKASMADSAKANQAAAKNSASIEALTVAQKETSTAVAAVSMKAEAAVKRATASASAVKEITTAAPQSNEILNSMAVRLEALTTALGAIKADIKSGAALADPAAASGLVDTANAAAKAAAAAADTNAEGLKTLSTNIDGRLDTLSSGLKDLQSQIAALVDRANKATGKSLAASILALNDLRDGLQSGKPFTKLLARAQSVLPDANPLMEGPWVAFADKGMPNDNDLRSEMQTISVVIGQDKLKNQLSSGEGWLDKAVGGIVGRLKVRRVGASVEGDGPAAVAARAEAALADGDTARAIEQVEALKSADAERFAAWLTSAKAAVAAKSDIDAIEKAAIAAADGA
jgi:hypothetical protein